MLSSKPPTGPTLVGLKNKNRVQCLVFGRLIRPGCKTTSASVWSQQLICESTIPDLDLDHITEAECGTPWMVTEVGVPLMALKIWSESGRTLFIPSSTGVICEGVSKNINETNNPFILCLNLNLQSGTNKLPKQEQIQFKPALMSSFYEYFKSLAFICDYFLLKPQSVFKERINTLFFTAQTSKKISQWASKLKTGWFSVSTSASLFSLTRYFMCF